MTELKNIAMIGAGAAGAVALAFGASGIAGAQDDAPTLQDPATGEAQQDGAENGRRGRGDRPVPQDVIDGLIEDGTITAEEAEDATAVREVLQEQRAAAKAEKLATAAEVLGVSVEDLEAAKEAGTPIAEIEGANVEAFADHLVAQKTEKIAEKVANGDITQEQADEKLDGLAERVQTRIDEGGGLGRRGNGPKGGGDRGPAAQAGAQTEAA